MSSARVVLVDADAGRRVQLGAALQALGLSQLHDAANPDEALRIAAAEPVDLCIVDLRTLADARHAAHRTIPVNPFRDARIPAILIGADVGAVSARAAAAAGYDAVMAAPAIPRFLYRRIGWALQRSRRNARRERRASPLPAQAEIQTGFRPGPDLVIAPE
jgi:CheY-like chemotaxis protein